jgi:hypothetical protein
VIGAVEGAEVQAAPLLSQNTPTNTDVLCAKSLRELRDGYAALS